VTRIIAIVEGQTEKQFVKKILAPHLGQKNIFMSARLIGKPGHKGGIGNWQRAKNEICALLNQDSQIFCTTMFDYYGMPLNWPGRNESKNKSFHSPKVVELAINKEIMNEMSHSFHAHRFFSYIQMFEFEALLFSDPQLLANTLQAKQLNDAFQKILSQYKSPEHINDHPDNAPSHRIIKYYPGYQKIFHGIIAAKRIGIEVMRKKCHHFNEWLEQIETISCVRSTK